MREGWWGLVEERGESQGVGGVGVGAPQSLRFSGRVESLSSWTVISTRADIPLHHVDRLTTASKDAGRSAASSSPVRASAPRQAPPSGTAAQHRDKPVTRHRTHNALTTVFAPAPSERTDSASSAPEREPRSNSAHRAPVDHG